MAETNSLDDLLDDELTFQTAADEETEAKSVPKGKKCLTCGDTLPPDTHFCISCGSNNRDLEGQVGATALEHDELQQKLIKSTRPRHWFWAWFFWLGR